MSDSHILTWADQTLASGFTESESPSLMQRCLDGDETAQVILYNQHSAMVYRLAYGLLQNKEDAEEVLQDSFEYALRKLANFDPDKSAFKTWLYRITVSRCRNKRRRKWLPTFSLNQYPDLDLKDNQAVDPDDQLELDEQQRAVWQGVKLLSRKLRETAILRYYHGLKYGEIGQILGISAKTAESRMRLAHKALRDHLEDLGTEV